ncbi:hypothetical protein LSM04_007913 [Trypanosoma melophagium]|uniref:uncharacterized protein n=1 Tax=Trypanosoma melophagium TaxID=715481 RepID=UPI003519DEFE|nr:hypothetical protein LSM04_007913 [Trypanosoma melophagium]
MATRYMLCVLAVTLCFGCHTVPVDTESEVLPNPEGQTLSHASCPPAKSTGSNPSQCSNGDGAGRGGRVNSASQELSADPQVKGALNGQSTDGGVGSGAQLEQKGTEHVEDEEKKALGQRDGNLKGADVSQGQPTARAGSGGRTETAETERTVLQPHSPGENKISGKPKGEESQDSTTG